MAHFFTFKIPDRVITLVIIGTIGWRQPLDLADNLLTVGNVQLQQHATLSIDCLAHVNYIFLHCTLNHCHISAYFRRVTLLREIVSDTGREDGAIGTVYTARGAAVRSVSSTTEHEACTSWLFAVVYTMSARQKQLITHICVRRPSDSVESGAPLCDRENE